MNHNFIYKDQSYPFNKDIFIKYSSCLHNVDKENKNYFLLSEFDYRLDLTEESITIFIQFCQNKKVDINNSNALSINFLAKKYNVKLLIEKTEEYIMHHYKEIINQFLSLRIELIDKLNEDLLAQFISEFISDDRLLFLRTSNLYRILSEFYLQQRKKGIKEKETNRKIIEFLFKYLEKNGIESSILFSLIDINDEDIEYVSFMLSKYGDNFDFRFLSPIIFQSINSRIRLQKIKDEKMQKEHEEKEKELRKIIDQQTSLFQKQLSFIYSNIGQLNLPNDKQIIKENEFRGFAFNDFVIPSNIKIIESGAFSKCLYLTQITIPSSVTSIGSFAFAECSSLLQIIIPSSVTQIERGTFLNCSSLVQIVVHSSLKSIQNDAFFGCKSLKKLKVIDANDSESFFVFQLNDVNFENEKSIDNCIFKLNLLIMLINEKLIYTKNSILLENDSIIHKISLIALNPDKKELIVDLFKEIESNNNCINFIDKIFPYFLFKNSNLSQICYWLPLFKIVIENEIHLTLTIDNNKIEFNKFSLCDFSFDLTLNEKDSLSLSKDSGIYYSKNKKSVKVKEHLIEDNNKLNFLFYTVISELSKNPHQLIQKTSLKNLITKARNQEIQHFPNNKILSLKHFFQQNSVPIICLIWNAVYSLPENLIIDLSTIIHPVESRLLLSSLNIIKSLKRESFDHIIYWCKWVYDIENKAPILFESIMMSDFSHINLNTDKLISNIKDEINYLQKAPEQINDFWNSADLIIRCKKGINQLEKKQ